MNFKYFLIVLLFIAVQSFSQEKSSVLFFIDNQPYYSQEFIKIYNKNSAIIDVPNDGVTNYLELFVNYKLKVKAAKDLGLDTVRKFKNELKQYKNKLVLPYLRDKKVTSKLVREVYERLKKEVNVSHILIFLNANVSPKDTLATYNKLIEARDLILKGADFSEIAKNYSNDPSVKQNGGNLGYFTTLQMVYPFENAAFNTPVNGVSKPFRTKYGYHILKVNDIRNSKGEVEVAHIMLKNNNAAKKKIDSIYNILVHKRVNFNELAKNVSEDKASAIHGGKLTKFSAGKMIESFSNVAFSLKKEGEISKPFKTQFGWHIIQLIKKYPIKKFNEIEKELTQKIINDERSNLIGKSVIDKLFKQYKIVVDTVALKQFEKVDWRTNPEKFQTKILSIENKEISQKTFIKYLKTLRNKSVKRAFNNFKIKEVLDFYKDNIEYSNSEFAETYKEFKEGLLLFDLLEKKVWDKSKDSIGLTSYFNKNKKQKYKANKLKNIKGNVIADYQNYLEKELIKQLKTKYKVKFNKPERKRIIKKLNKESKL